MDVEKESNGLGNRKKMDIRKRLFDHQYEEDIQSCRLWERLMAPIGQELIEQNEVEIGSYLLTPIKFQGLSDVKEEQSNNHISISDFWEEPVVNKANQQGKKRQISRKSPILLNCPNHEEEVKIEDFDYDALLYDLPSMKDEKTYGKHSYHLF